MKSNEAYIIPGLSANFTEIADPHWFNYDLISPKRTPTISDINQLVANYFNLPSYHLKKDTRKRNVLKFRQIAIYFQTLYAKKDSVKEIANYYGRNHATALHSYKVVKRDRKSDKDLDADCQAIDEWIKHSFAISEEEQIPKGTHNKLVNLISVVNRINKPLKTGFTNSSTKSVMNLILSYDMDWELIEKKARYTYIMIKPRS
jgi:hypothetical protein